MFDTKDPLLNLAIFAVLGMFAIGLLVFAAVFLVPVAAVGGIGYYFYQKRVAEKIAGPETQQLVQTAAATTAPPTKKYLEDFAEQLIEALERNISQPVFVSILNVVEDLYNAEHLGELPPAPPPGTIEHARYRDMLITRSQKGTQQALDQVTSAFADFAMSYVRELPPSAQQYAENATTTVPLIDLIDDLPDLIMTICTPFFEETLKPAGLFGELRKKIDARFNEHGNPRDFKGTPREMVRAYFGGTPFYELFGAHIPFVIPIDKYKEHGFLFAKSGHGKSQTMRAILTSLFEEECALFILDGNGALIEGLDKIASIKDRIVVLDPDEVPALNFFTMTGSSREKQMELFFYLFKAIDQGLTERQATMVSYLVDLMQSIPGATLDTLREVCESKTLTHPTNDLEPIVQDWFANQFSKDKYANDTKAQIAARLYTIGRNRLFSAMFNAPNNAFNALELMQQKKIVIVNTSRDKLGDQGSAIFGRYILAQCLAAAWQRPRNERHLALIMVDEAKTYLDEQSKKILSDARAFGVGLLLASQFPDQLDEGVRKEVVNNTTIKLAGPAAYSVVSQLNRDMRCEAEFILSMKKRDPETNPKPPYYAEWACYVDNLTPHAIRLRVPFGTIEKLPMMGEREWKEMRARNRKRFGASATPPPRVVTLPHQVPVSFPDYGVSFECLLDSGADGSMLATKYTVSDTTATFTLGNRTPTLPFVRWVNLVGINGKSRHPVVALRIDIAGHVAEEEFALTDLDDGSLIGRSFLAGRIHVRSDENVKPQPRKSPTNIPERDPTKPEEW